MKSRLLVQRELYLRNLAQIDQTLKLIEDYPDFNSISHVLWLLINAYFGTGKTL